MKTFFVAACLTALWMTPAAAQEAEQPSQTTETFGAWTVRCVAQADQPQTRQCEAVHSVSTNGGVIAQVAIAAAQEGRAQVVAVTPLGVKLAMTPQIGIAGSGDPVPLPWDMCMAGGCVARASIAQSEVSALAGTGGLVLSFTEGAGRRLDIEIPTSGLAASLGRLSFAPAE